MVALGLRIYQLARPNYLFGPTTYDDGADFGTALRLIEGSLPYRDYVFLHPPGIAVLLSPVALLAKAIGTDGGFAVARILTACASAAGVLLVGLLVRHRGVLATTLACGLLAVNPDGILDASSVFLEPWLMRPYAVADGVAAPRTG
jgi:alpha-1,2-mannosyltransferase